MDLKSCHPVTSVDILKIMLIIHTLGREGNRTEMFKAKSLPGCHPGCWRAWNGVACFCEGSGPGPRLADTAENGKNPGPGAHRPLW